MKNAAVMSRVDDRSSRAPDPAPAVLVLGMGVTGASCARFFAARGLVAWFADSRREPPGLAAIRDAMPGATCFNGNPIPPLPASITRVIVSPGVNLDLPVIAEARQRGLQLLSDLDLFAAESRAPAIGITGSNGKSTVTSMVGALLAADGWPVGVGGNLGTPALDLLDPGVRAYVLELSSFQLERSAPLPIAAAVVLNVAPDHLDKHGTMAAYAEAKARIYARCGIAVVNRDAPELAALVPAGTPVLRFGLSKPRDGEFGIVAADGGESLAFGRELIMRVDELRLTGRHNVSNALAALALGHAVGARLATMAEGLRRFQGLPHRMQVVCTSGGVTWINDSKATNVAAAVTSIRGITGPLVLIAGGDGKGQGFEELAAALGGRDSVAILIGRDRERIAAALAGACIVELAESLPAAVGRARQIARPGHTVLLAPACSSLDMFRSYEQRGEIFAAAARGAQP
jgi:UDP-N-acetylmuramoylalanine--D-glutamate ligase